METRHNFGSKIGAVLASAGSAVGLGNVWRFPTEVGNNGGAAFIFIYLICIALIGIPVMMSEFLIGRHTHANTISAFAKLAPGKWWRIEGVAGVFVAFLILSYYIVISGWTLFYLIESVAGRLQAGRNYSDVFNNFVSDPWLPVLTGTAFMGLTHFIISRGVQSGIERFSKVMMPMLLFIIGILVICSFSMPGSSEGLRFLLKPDLSGIQPGTLHEGVINEARHNFHEGIQLTKRGGTYYLVFADVARHGRPTCIGYAVSDKPFGPYKYRGVIIDNFGCDPETWNNHGGIVEHGGKWYVVYHRATNASRSLRKACVEPIEFAEDGSIMEAEMTSNGAGPLLDAFAETPARLACVMSGSVRIETCADGRERLAKVHSGDSATWRYFDMPRTSAKLTLRVVPRTGGIIELRDGKGASYGRVVVPSGDGKEERTLDMALERPLPTGRCAVTLGFHGRGGSFCGRNDANLFDVVSFQFSERY